MAMERPLRKTWAPKHSAFRGLGWLGAALAWTAAALVGVVLAVVFAATLVVVAVVGCGALAVAALRARRIRRARAAEPGVIEARHIGGHSWVAYGWDP